MAPSHSPQLAPNSHPLPRLEEADKERKALRVELSQAQAAATQAQVQAAQAAAAALRAPPGASETDSAAKAVALAEAQMTERTALLEAKWAALLRNLQEDFTAERAKLQGARAQAGRPPTTPPTVRGSLSRRGRTRGAPRSAR